MKVTILGNIGSGNFGDEVLLSSVLDILGKTGVRSQDIVIISKNPHSTTQAHNIRAILHSFKLASLAQIIRVLINTDILLLGGGGLLNFSHDVLAPVYYLSIVFLAKLLQKKVVLLGVGCSVSLKSSLPLRVLKRLIVFSLNRVDALLVRDRDSKTNLEILGVKNVDQCVDLCFGFTPIQTNIKLPLVAINVRPWFFSKISRKIHRTAADEESYQRFLQTMADLADYVIDKYGVKVIFIPFSLGEEYENDLNSCNMVHSLMKYKQNAEVVLLNSSPFSAYLDLLSEVQISVGMRYHFLAFSALAGTPMVGIAYDAKINALLDSFELDAVSITDIEVERLKKIVDNTMLNSEVLRENLKKRADLMHRQFNQFEEVMRRIKEQYR